MEVDKQEITPFIAKLIDDTQLSDERKREIAVSEKRKRDIYTRFQMFAPEAVETLVDIMRIGKDKDRLAAANKILEYAIGRPQENRKTEELMETVLTPAEYKEITSEENEEELQRMIEAKYIREQ